MWSALVATVVRSATFTSGVCCHGVRTPVEHQPQLRISAGIHCWVVVDVDSRGGGHEGLLVCGCA
jgi:hypothetical protein